jgi:hypothetical protein
MKGHKWIAMLISLLLALSMAGCGGGDKKSDAQPEA